MATQSNLDHSRLHAAGGRHAADVRGVADRPADRRHVSQPRGLPRARQQVPAHHQRQRHSHQGEGQRHAERFDHGGVHGDDLRADRAEEPAPAPAAPGAAAAARRRRSRPCSMHAAVVTSSAAAALSRPRVGAPRRRPRHRRRPAPAATPAAPRDTPAVTGGDRPGSSSRRATPTTRRADAIRSSACCAAAATCSARLRGMRPAGLAGLETAEVTLKGTHREPGQLRRHCPGLGQQDLHRQGRATSCSTARFEPSPRQHGDRAAGDRSAVAGKTARSAQGAPTDAKRAK